MSVENGVALREERHSGKVIFPECNTRGRAVLEKENLHLTSEVNGTEWKKLL
jgi:hypothetical protein